MKKDASRKDVLLRLRVSQELKDKLEADAAERGISVSELVRRRMVRKPYVRRKGGEESNGKD
jgi:predicted HicB family RNase H-like nuclease